MSSQNAEEKTLLPHHVQQPLCTTRLAYRQGREFTAVKVYTVNDESVHLLVFGVPSLNLRQETKALFSKFGKLLQFNVAPKYPAEQFTETYHALFERIQSARIAKKLNDGKNFYGGVLHVCYAPEFESLEQLRNKLMQRRKDVYNRLKKKEDVEQIEPKEIKPQSPENTEIINEVEDIDKNYSEVTEAIIIKPAKMNMGAENVIMIGKKRKKKMKERKGTKGKKEEKLSTLVEVIDCTQVDKDTVTNIYEVLNEKVEVRKMPQRTLNKIEFFIKK